MMIIITIRAIINNNNNICVYVLYHTCINSYILCMTHAVVDASLSTLRPHADASPAGVFHAAVVARGSQTLGSRDSHLGHLPWRSWAGVAGSLVITEPEAPGSFWERPFLSGKTALPDVTAVSKLLLLVFLIIGLFIISASGPIVMSFYYYYKNHNIMCSK